MATRKGLFELQRLGGAWRLGRVSFAGEPVSMVLPATPEQPLLAALDLGHFGVKLHASDDAGAHWRELPTPADPVQPEHAAGPAWTLEKIWSLEARGRSLWAGTLPGGLFRSDDRGETWQLDTRLWLRPERARWAGGGFDVPGIRSICPHPDGSVLVGVSCGGAWRSADDGAAWLQDRARHARGLRAARARRRPRRSGPPPDRALRGAARRSVVPASQRLWRSNNGGARWDEVTDVPVSNFGFTVAVHPCDPHTAWFVPATSDQCRVPVAGALVVNRTRDGGTSFETLRSGLPQTDCYDLVYRHGLAVDACGRGLVLGSSTGGVWTSDDGGEHWRHLPARLPPIYAVRMG